MTTGTSLMLIAAGAVLAFAISFQVAGINIASVGAILMVVGIIGLAISVLTIVGYAPWSGKTGGGNAAGTAPGSATPATPAVAPQASVVVVGASAPTPPASTPPAAKATPGA